MHPTAMSCRPIYNILKGLTGVYKDLAPPRHGQLVSVVPPTQIGSLTIYAQYRIIKNVENQ